jgi:hypothetical protein
MDAAMQSLVNQLTASLALPECRALLLRVNEHVDERLAQGMVRRDLHKLVSEIWNAGVTSQASDECKAESNYKQIKIK